jgi:tetratricopeptide (TPR) repeat protein
MQQSHWGILKSRLVSGEKFVTLTGDKQGAIADFNKAIEIKPDFENAYYGRGNVRFALGDKQGAIADLNKAIDFDPKSAGAYSNRGLARYGLEDKQGAIADLNKAASLFQEAGETKKHQQVLDVIQKLQQQ